MTENVPKKRGPKPKPKVVEAEAVAAPSSVEVYAEAIVSPVVEPVNMDPVPEARSFPLIDGVDPVWAQHVSVGSRHIQFVARDDVKHADLIGMLSAGTVTLHGHATPILIASRTITPPKLHPVRVTFTVRENINA